MDYWTWRTKFEDQLSSLSPEELSVGGAVSEERLDSFETEVLAGESPTRVQERAMDYVRGLDKNLIALARSGDLAAAVARERMRLYG